MKILTIKTSDRRKRYRFISEPLKYSEHLNVDVLAKGYLFPFQIFFSFLKNRDATVVLLFGGGGKNYVAYLLSKIFGFSVVVRLGGALFVYNDMHDYVIKQAKQEKRYFYLLFLLLYGFLNRKIISNADAFILVNKSLLHTVEPFAVEHVPKLVVPQYGPLKVPLPEQYNGDQFNNGEQFRIITVANLNSLKKAAGVIWIIEQLLQFIKKTNESICFTVLGGGYYLKNIEDFWQRKHKGNRRLNLKILGFQNNVLDYLVQSDLFVYNSEADALPNVLLESKAVKTPILLNNFAPFEEVVNHMHTGIFYQNEDDFYKKLYQLFHDNELRKEISDNALRDFYKRFSFEAVKKNVGEAFEIIEKFVRKNVNHR